MPNPTLFACATIPWVWRDGPHSQAQPLSKVNRDLVMSRITDEIVAGLVSDLKEETVPAEIMMLFDDAVTIDDEIVKAAIADAIDTLLICEYGPRDITHALIGPDGPTKRWYAVSISDSGCPSVNHMKLAMLEWLDLYVDTLDDKTSSPGTGRHLLVIEDGERKLDQTYPDEESLVAALYEIGNDFATRCGSRFEPETDDLDEVVQEAQDLGLDVYLD